MVGVIELHPCEVLGSRALGDVEQLPHLLGWQHLVLHTTSHFCSDRLTALPLFQLSDHFWVQKTVSPILATPVLAIECG